MASPSEDGALLGSCGAARDPRVASWALASGCVTTVISSGCIATVISSGGTFRKLAGGAAAAMNTVASWVGACRDPVNGPDGATAMTTVASW